MHDRTVTLSFLHYLREEIKFSGIEPLIEQMKQDKLEAKKILGLN
ncbi:riboflavin kinase [Robertmurraya massiliosenegalensis]